MGIKKALRPEPQTWDVDLAGACVLYIPPPGGSVRGGIAILGDSQDQQIALAERIRNLLALSDACLDKLDPGEPFFVLRGKDATAAILVQSWAAGAERVGACPEKVAEARATADAMQNYHGRRMPT